MRIEEAVNAIAVYPNYTPTFEKRNRLPNPKKIVRYCSSLTNITTRSQKRYLTDLEMVENATIEELQLAHPSVKEYLLSASVKDSFKPHFNSSRANAVIVEVSLAYLLSAAQDTSTPTNQIYKIFPLTEYAAEGWMKHAAMVEKHEDSAQSWIMKLFTVSGAYIYWVREYNPDYYSCHRSGGKFAQPLYYASVLGQAKVVSELIAEGADVDAIGGRYGTALAAASARGHPITVQLLIDNKADVNLRVYSTALYDASEEGQEEVVELLLENGADTYVRSVYDDAALEVASYNDCESIVKMLLTKYADCNDPEKIGVLLCVLRLVQSLKKLWRVSSAKVPMLMLRMPRQSVQYRLHPIEASRGS